MRRGRALQGNRSTWDRAHSSTQHTTDFLLTEVAAHGLRCLNRGRSSRRGRAVETARRRWRSWGTGSRPSRCTLRSRLRLPEVGELINRAYSIRPAQLTFALDISELRLVTSSLPPPSSSTLEFLLTLETTLTITYTEWVQNFRNTKADSLLDQSQAAFCPRPTSLYWSPAKFSYSHLVPARPFSLSFDIPAPSGDQRDDTPVIDAVLALSIIDPISKALIFTEKIQLVQELHLSLGETRCIRPIDEQEAYAEVTWRWNVPRSATTMGVTAREMGGKEAGKGKLSQRGMEKILEKALEEEERKAKLMMLSSTEVSWPVFSRGHAVLIDILRLFPATVSFRTGLEHAQLPQILTQAINVPPQRHPRPFTFSQLELFRTRTSHHL